MDGSTQLKRETRGETPPKKLPYTPPVLTKYGDIVSLTLGIEGSGTDNSDLSA